MEIKSSYRNDNCSNLIKVEIFGVNEIAEQGNKTGVKYASGYDEGKSQNCAQGDAKSNKNVNEERSSVVSIRVQNNFYISQLGRENRELLLVSIANSVCREVLMFFCSAEELESYDKNKASSPF